MSAQPSATTDDHSAAALEDEARFVARLTIDLCIEQIRINNGNGRPNVPGTVTQVIGTLQEVRRQLAAVRAGEATIEEGAQP